MLGLLTEAFNFLSISFHLFISAFFFSDTEEMHRSSIPHYIIYISPRLFSFSFNCYSLILLIAFICESMHEHTHTQKSLL